MTNGKVYQGFHNDKKIEEHYFKVLTCVMYGIYVAACTLCGGEQYAG